MKTIVLITCVAEKQHQKSAAKEMYTGDLFVKLMTYAESLKPDKTFILSGKYDLLSLNDSIEYYDVNLNECSEAEQIEWSNKVLQKLRQEADLQKDMFIFLTNETYRKYLIKDIKHFEIPFYIE